MMALIWYDVDVESLRFSLHAEDVEDRDGAEAVGKEAASFLPCRGHICAVIRGEDLDVIIAGSG